MKKKTLMIQLVAVIALSVSFVLPGHARDLKASLGFVPGMVDSADKGFGVDFVKALDEIYTDGVITIDVYPTNRALDNVIKGTHDFMIPMLKTDSMKEAELPFRLFEDLWTAVFVLYTNKSNTEINPGNIEKFKVETDRNAMQFFDKPFLPSLSSESSLKKVDINRIDGYVFAMPETDAVLKQLNLKNIKRQKYAAFSAPIAVAKGPQGDEIVKILTPLIQQLRDNGTYDRILAPVLDKPFVEW